MNTLEALDIFMASDPPPALCPVEIAVAGGPVFHSDQWAIYRTAVASISGMLPAVSDVESLREATEHGESLLLGGVIDGDQLQAEITDIVATIIERGEAFERECASHGLSLPAI